MESLSFASEDEAVQYLSNKLEKNVIIAGAWTDIWTKAGEIIKLLPNEYASIKRSLSNLEGNLEDLASEIDSNIKSFSFPGDIAQVAHQLTISKGTTSLKMLGVFLVQLDKLFKGSNDLSVLKKTMDEYKNLLKVYVGTSKGEKSKQGLEKLVGDSITSIVQDTLKSVLESIRSSGVKSGPVFASFDSEKEAMQFLSDNIGMKIIVSSESEENN